MITINWRKAIAAGLLATVVGFAVEFVLYSAANGVYESYGELAYARPVESISAYLTQMMIGGALLNVLLALAYAIIHTGLPGAQWKKGLSFWLILLVVNMLPMAFNTWMQIAQPVPLILVEAANRSIGLMITALVVAVVYGRGTLKRAAATI